MTRAARAVPPLAAWGPVWEPRLAGTPHLLRALAEHRDWRGGAVPVGMASLLAIEGGHGRRHRKQEHVAINPVKFNDVFSSIFS